MRARFAACRPGYSFEFRGARWQVRCVDGSVIADTDASSAVCAEAAACVTTLPPEASAQEKSLGLTRRREDAWI